MSFLMLNNGYKAAFTAGWRAFREGNPPMGAAVTDGGEKPVASAANAVKYAVKGQPIGGQSLAHAALNALLQAARGMQNGNVYSLYLTEEPCRMCLGAAAVSGIKRLHYAMEDTVAGAVSSGCAEGLDMETIEMEQEAGRVQAVLYGYYLLENGGKDGAEMKMLEKLYPASAALAAKLRERDALRGFAKNGAGIDEVYDFLLDKLKM